MARAPRILFQNAWYHIMNRGAGRREIFHNDDQRKFFLELLSVMSSDFDISVAMKFLGATYTRKFNRLTRKDGPLFRSRYKAIVINADSYWAQVSRYIHRNPVEAKMVNVAGEKQVFHGLRPTQRLLKLRPDIFQSHLSQSERKLAGLKTLREQRSYGLQKLGRQ